MLLEEFSYTVVGIMCYVIMYMHLCICDNVLIILGVIYLSCSGIYVLYNDMLKSYILCAHFFPDLKLACN